jgi:hypothetical protein
MLLKGGVLKHHFGELLVSPPIPEADIRPRGESDWLGISIAGMSVQAGCCVSHQ